MKITGNRLMKGSRQEVWDIFQDPKALEKSFPGIDEFKEAGEDQWEATVTMGVAAIKGSYSVKIGMSDKIEPSHYKLSIEGSGKPGWVKAEGLFDLEEEGANTRVVYDLDAQVGGLVAGVGQRLLSGVAKMIFKQFFSNMEKQLAARQVAVAKSEQ